MNRALKSILVPRKFEYPQVIVSSCLNVFQNLALEDWIYKNVQFLDSRSKKSHPELFIIWRNEPCVVIGRHQNAWVELNTYHSLKQNIDVARRRSGGGTVYHDPGNLNLTFFTSRQHYNRRRNLSFIANHLKKEFNLDVAINPRDDLILNNTFKISGTAAKLGSKLAYHHFTLLVDADLHKARKLLQISKEGIVSKATSSISSPIANLVDFKPRLTVETLIDSLVNSYSFVDYGSKNVTIDPTDEERFPGIQEMSNELQQWSWVYGHTPTFTVERGIPFPGLHAPILVQFDVDKGCIVNMDIKSKDAGFTSRYAGLVKNAIQPLIGVRYWPDDLKTILTKETPDVQSDDTASLTKWLVASTLNELMSN